MRTMWEGSSSNPALAGVNDFSQAGDNWMTEEARRDTQATMSGVINTTGILVAMTAAAGLGGYVLADRMGGVVWLGMGIVSLIAVLGIFFALRSDPTRARYLAPVYAIVEGGFLGAGTLFVDRTLAAQGYQVAGGVAIQAFLITVGSLITMLTLYRTGILKPTERFKSVIFLATGAIFIVYIVSFVVSLFGVHVPFVSAFSAATETGSMAWIGLGINLVIFAIASLWLIIDFGEVEKIVQGGSPKAMEWYAGFILLVTLAWIYWESVKLVARLAVLFGNRE